jgi:hypothetical protein
MAQLTDKGYLDRLKEQRDFLLKVDKSKAPVYLNTTPPEFYIRTGNSSQPLDVRQATKYTQDHW